MIMKDRIPHHLDAMPSEIRMDIQREFGVNVSYHRLWKGKVLALKGMYESSEESYSLPSQVLGVNPAVQTRYSVKLTCHSLRFFRNF